MGGLFRAPTPAAPPPSAAPTRAAAPVPAASGSGADGEADSQRRIAALEARRRGLPGMVATSWRGVLAEALPPLRRKSLLGE